MNKPFAQHAQTINAMECYTHSLITEGLAKALEHLVKGAQNREEEQQISDAVYALSDVIAERCTAQRLMLDKLAS